jgi:transcriptional regulator with XRE-family HTH domain
LLSRSDAPTWQDVRWRRKAFNPSIKLDMMSSNSAKPFGEALRALMDAHGLTYRALAERIREVDGKGITHAHINMLANGHDKPSMRAMELIAAACDVDPDYFAEYRLAVAMRELDPNEVGLEQALANLNARLGARRRPAAKRRSAPAPQAQSRPTS